MFDLKWIRENPERFDHGMRRRGLDPQSPRILDLDARHRAAQTELQEMQNRRNAASKEIGQKKQSGDEAGADDVPVLGNQVNPTGFNICQCRIVTNPSSNRLSNSCFPFTVEKL